jgi:hypothetical protein
MTAVYSEPIPDSSVRLFGAQSTETKPGYITVLPAETDLKARIKIPKEGKRISGNRVSIMADITVGQIEDVDNVRFQYRILPSETWVDIPAANVNHPNPDETHPYFVHWDVTGLPSPSTCELRAVATSVEQVADPAPDITTVIIDHGAPEWSEGQNAEGNQECHSLLIASERNELGSADPVSGIGVLVTIPPDALTGNTDGTILFQPAAYYEPSLGPYDSNCSAYLDLTLDNGQVELLDGEEAVIEAHYRDADQDGLIDGTSLSELGLVLCSYDTESGTWVPLEITASSPVANTLEGLTTHLSSFGLIGRDDDGDRLSNEFEETISDTSRTNGDSDEDGVTDYDEVAHDGDPGNYDPYDPDTNPTGTDLDANDPDTDGDHLPDGFEMQRGSDPLDGESTPFVPLTSAFGLLAITALLTAAGLFVMIHHRTRQKAAP